MKRALRVDGAEDSIVPLDVDTAERSSKRSRQESSSNKKEAVEEDVHDEGPQNAKAVTNRQPQPSHATESESSSIAIKSHNQQTTTSQDLTTAEVASDKMKEDSEEENEQFEDADIPFFVTNNSNAAAGLPHKKKTPVVSSTTTLTGKDSLMNEIPDEIPTDTQRGGKMTPHHDNITFEVPNQWDARAFLTPKAWDETSSKWQGIVEQIEQGLESPLELLESNNSDDFGASLYLKWLLQKKRLEEDESKIQDKERMAKLLADATIEGSPREYQRILLERALQQNTIVYLGTGYGKTLIALMLIKERSKEWTTTKQQTLFLVPSVALAIQQSMSLRANLPFTVATACNDTSNSDESRRQMHQAQILVATHGALLDLLMHYGDMFQMKRFNLVVIDECHYCVGNHSYALIMKKFYHTLPKEDRPHVLGLTASPLVNVRDKNSDEELESMLRSLEETMDAKLAAAEPLISEPFRRAGVVEKVVTYQDSKTGRLPTADNLPLHPSRFREFRQLESLYQDLGPLPVQLYCEALRRELSRNEFEKEPPQAYEAAMKHLDSLVNFCKQESATFSYHGRTDKLVALEELLESEIEQKPGSHPVGLVFTDRRLTAVALHNYFQWRDGMMDKKGMVKLYSWGRAAESRRSRGEKPISKLVASGMETGNPHVEDDKFADSADDPFLEFQSKPMAVTASRPHFPEQDKRVLTDQMSSGEVTGTIPDVDDMFADSADDPFLEFHNTPPQPENRTRIQSTALVRNIATIFNSLSIERKPATISDELRQSWLHINNKPREVLTRLRRQELNVLFATSLVEEGVDVQACSFVVAFDAIRSTKSYVQMKGRARRRDAKFFVFEDTLDKNGGLPLATAQEMERRVQGFVESKFSEYDFRLDIGQSDHEDTLTEPELAALRQGFFKADHGVVDLHSARSLLCRYALSVPMDPFARSSKETLLAHMPDFQENSIILPSHLPARIRTVTLPESYQRYPKKEKRKMLSLMACVRLHSHGLLNSRLLPLTSLDMSRKVQEASAPGGAHVVEYKVPLQRFYSGDGHESKELFVYPVNHQNLAYKQLESCLKSEGHVLGLVFMQPMKAVIPTFEVPHKEFGVVTISLGKCIETKCSSEQFRILQESFVALMNGRWCRRSRGVFFELRKQSDYEAPFTPFLAGILSKDGEFDWNLMSTIIAENRRSVNERKLLVARTTTATALPRPRMWTSIDGGHTQYICYGPADQLASADFPSEIEGVRTYKDYFEKIRKIVITADDQLFDVQRPWSQPSAFNSMSSQTPSVQHKSGPALEGKYDMFPLLSAVKVPQSACMEAPIAEPHVCLLTCFLPQLAFAFERHQMVDAFYDFCSINHPSLWSCLGRLPRDTVAAALTAKSCGMDMSYEKLEWFGDAALKMVQTESLLKSTELRDWIRFLHEGDLSLLRQEMGSNKNLEQACRKSGIGRFILSAQLARGKWTPSCLNIIDGDSTKRSNDSGKMYADIIESLLGLVYIHFGYKDTQSVADDLGVTVLWSEPPEDHETGSFVMSDHLRETIGRATGYSSFRRPELIEEAMAHPSAANSNVSSFERLEWIGDAVLCLAAREWIWENFRDLDLGEMVIMESAIVSNEALSFLSVHWGLHCFLEHNDHTLPPRIESYICSIQEDGCGLWGTDPPKSIADIVESLLGAIYMDAGLVAGLQAARSVLGPICHALTTLKQEDKAIQLMHPRKALQELTGELVELRMAWESDFIKLCGGTMKVLEGNHLRLVDPLSANAVAYLCFMDSILVAVSSRSANVARNHVCSLFVHALRRKPHFVERLSKLRYNVERRTTAMDENRDGDQLDDQDQDEG